MEAEILCVCERAELRDSLLDITGAYNRLLLPAFPARILELHVAVRVCYSVEEDGEHVISLAISGLEGVEIGLPLQEILQVHTEGNQIHSWTTTVATFRDLQIVAPNDYTISLRVDGKLLGHTNLYVVKE